MVTNGQPESEPEPAHYTNGICDEAEVPLPVPADSIAQPYPVLSSQKLPSSARDIKLLSDSVLHDGQAVMSDGSDAVNGNYLSSGDDLVPSSLAPTSLSSEEATQKPCTVTAGRDTPAIQPVVSSGETMQSHPAATQYVTNGTVMDAVQVVATAEESSVVKSNSAVQRDVTSVETIDTTAPNEKQARVFTTAESVISSDGSIATGISTEQVGELINDFAVADTGSFSTDSIAKPIFVAEQHVVTDTTVKDAHDYYNSEDFTQKLPSTVTTEKTAQHPVDSATTDADSFSTDRSEKPTFSAEESTVIHTRDNDNRYDGHDSRGSTQKIQLIVETKETTQHPEESAANDLTCSITDSVVMAESVKSVKPSSVASDVLDVDQIASSDAMHAQFDDENMKYNARERPRDTAVDGDDRNVPEDQAGDTGTRSMSKAVKTGALAVVAAPYIAGKAIVDALRPDKGPSTGTSVNVNDVESITPHPEEEKALGPKTPDTVMGQGDTVHPSDMAPSTSASVTKGIPRELANEVDHAVLKPESLSARDHTDTRDDRLRTAPSNDIPKDLEDVSVIGMDQKDVGQLADVGASRKVTERDDEGDRRVPQHEVDSMIPSVMDAEPSKPLPSSRATAYGHDQDWSRQAGIVADVAATDRIAEGRDATGSDERYSCVELPKYDHSVEDEDKENDEQHDDTDKVDSAADNVDDDDDTASSQVAPRSVKMHEAVKGRQSGSTVSTVVCARPPRASGTRTSKTPSFGDVPEPVDGTEVPYDDESDKSKALDERLKHSIIVDEEEHDASEKSPWLERVDEVDRAAAVGFTDGDQSYVMDDQHPPTGHGRTQDDASLKEPAVHSPTFPVKVVSSHEIDVRSGAVTKHGDDAVQAMELGRSDGSMAVKDSESVTRHSEEENTLDPKAFNTEMVQGDRLHPSEKLADSETSSLPGKVADHAPDLQGPLTTKTPDDLHTLPKQNIIEQVESGRMETQQLDNRQTDAEVAMLRPLEIRQRVDSDDDKKSIAHEHPQVTGMAVSDRNVPEDRAEDAGSRSVSKAIKTGALAAVAAPYLVGKAIADALRSDTGPTTSVPPSHAHGNQHIGEMTETLPEDQQRKPFKIGDDVATAFGPHAADDRQRLSKLPGQPDEDKRQQLDSAGGYRDEASDMVKTAVNLTESMNAHVMLDTSTSNYQTSDSSEVSLQQQLAEQASEAAGCKEPTSSEIHDDRSAQSSMKIQPLLPVMATTKPSEITVTSAVPSVSCQPLISTLNSGPLTAASSLTQDTAQPVVSAAASTVPSLGTVQSTVSTTTSTAVPSKTMQSVPDAESTVSSLESVKPELMTAFTAPLSEPVQPLLSTTASTAVPSQTVQPVVSVTSTVSLSETQDTTQPVVSAAASTVPSLGMVQSTVSTTIVTAVPSRTMQPAELTVSSVESMKPVLSTTASTVPSSESARSIVTSVPSTQSLTAATQSVLPAPVSTQTSPQTSVSVVSALPSLISSQTTASNLSSSPTSTTSSTSLVTSGVFSDEYDIAAHTKPISELPESSQAQEETVAGEVPGEQTGFVDSSTAVAPAVDSQVLLNVQKKAEAGDEIRDVQPEQTKQHAILDADLDERNKARFDSPVQQPWQNISERSQPESEPHESGLSSIAESVKAAAKVGLLGVVGAPYLAGKTIVKSLRSKVEEEQNSQQTTGSRETYVEPDAAELQQSGQLSDEHSASAVTVLSDTRPSHKYSDTQAALQTEEFQQQVSVSSRDVGDQWKQLDTDKETKDRPEIAAYQPTITDEMRNDFDRSTESTSLPGLSLSEALLSRLYDQQNNCFIDPSTGHCISLASAIQLGLIDGNNKVIADLSSGEVISVLEALSRGIINPETGMVSVDGEAVVPLNEALASGLIMDDADGELLEMAASIGSAGGHTWNKVTNAADFVEESQKPARSIGAGYHGSHHSC